MTFQLISPTIIALIFCTVSGQRTPLEATWPFIQNLPFVLPTVLPIDVDSSKAIVVDVPPLIVNVPSVPLLVQNNGYTIFINQTGGPPVTMTGGVLFNSVYILKFISYLNDARVENGRASTTEDGLGSPVQFELFFYKEEYGSFENAQNFRDGMAIILSNVVVGGHIPNPRFASLGHAMLRVIQPGSTTSVNSVEVLKFLLQYLPQNYYYAYPGSLINIQSFEQIFCATMIQTAKNTSPGISVDQFQIFMQVLNRNYQPTTNVLPVHSYDGRPLVEAAGPVAVNYF